MFVKFRFTGRAGATSGLVIDADRYCKSTVGDLSRMFPYSEANKMARVESSPRFVTWGEAFAYSFEASDARIAKLEADAMTLVPCTYIFKGDKRVR